MSGGDRRDLRLLLVLLAVAVAVLGGLLLLGVPLAQEAAAVFAPGIGLETAALWGFGVTIALLVLFALVAGDSLIGELQFMLGAFFSFFFVLTLLIAWVF